MHVEGGLWPIAQPCPGQCRFGTIRGLDNWNNAGSVPARIGLIHEANLRELYHNRPGRNQDAIMSRRRWEVRPSPCMVVLQSKARLSS